jgi:hypothetical protein
MGALTMKADDGWQLMVDGWWVAGAGELPRAAAALAVWDCSIRDPAGNV